MSKLENLNEEKTTFADSAVEEVVFEDAPAEEIAAEEPVTETERTEDAEAAGTADAAMDSDDGFEEVTSEIPMFEELDREEIEEHPIPVSDEEDASVETLEEMLAAAAGDERPVRRIEEVAGEDIPDEEEEVKPRRPKKRKKKKRRGTGILLTLILIVLIAIAAIGYRLVKEMRSNRNPEPTPVTEQETAGTPETPAEQTTAAETQAETTAAAWQKDTNADILALVTSYYTALGAGDAETIKTLVDESVVVDADAIAAKNVNVEAYQDVATYVQDGQNAGEYAVYITYSTKLKDIETPAPGLVPAYVKTAADGSLKLIPYDSFDDAVSAYMGSIANSAQVKQLADQANDDYNAALALDADLRAYVTQMAGQSETSAPTEPAEETSADETAESGEVSESQEAGTEASESTQSAGDGTSFREIDDIQYTTTQVKLRAKPELDNETHDFLLIDGGVWVHVIAVNDEWAKVTTQSGKIGYIYRNYLQEDDPNE